MAVLDYRVNMTDVDLLGADGAGLLVVHDNEDTLCLVDGRLTQRADSAHAEIAVLIHRGDLGDVHVMVVKALDIAGDVAVVRGHEVAPAAVDGLARTGAGKP